MKSDEPRVSRNYKVRLSYLAVVLIWSTTPLAIQWSGESGHYLFGVTARMSLGLLLCLLVLYAMHLRLAWHKQALATYLAAALGIYGAMLCVYWGAQYIPSGWISVLFGLTPIVTDLMARYALNEPPLQGGRLVGVLLGIAGLILVFYDSLALSARAWWGVLALLLAVILHSASSVWAKAIAWPAHGLVITTGGLLLAVPAYWVTAWWTGMQWPQSLSMRAWWSILYLGTVATVLGFAAFFYILRYLPASQVALLPLMTPVLALWLGNALNHEPSSWLLLAGTGLILLGLGLNQWAKNSTS